MSRVINLEGARKERLQLCRKIIFALRELAKRKEPDEESKDLVAFIILSLKAITDTVEASVLAWEKRGYWIKADKYRLEWEWAGKYSDSLYKSLLNDDWQSITQLIIQTAQKLGAIKVPKRNTLGTPWKGSKDTLFSIKQP